VKRVPPAIRIVQTDERADVDWLITALVACSTSVPRRPQRIAPTLLPTVRQYHGLHSESRRGATAL